ncbi:MAG: tetratricopeptide repeat protein [Sphingomonadales bacterium]
MMNFIPRNLAALAVAVALFAWVGPLVPATAAEQDPEAWKSAAQLFDNGDYEAALQKLRPLAESGTAEAQWYLGYAAVTGNGVRKDPAKAVEWFEKAAEQDHPMGLVSLGIMYALGDGVEQDLARSFGLYTKAVKLGEGQAAKNIGTMYGMGQHVEKDLFEAAKWFVIGAALGSEESQAIATQMRAATPPKKLKKIEDAAWNWLKENGFVN